METASLQHPVVKKYDLEERTKTFARRVRDFVKKLPRTIGNFEDGKQLIRSSGSVAANYIEANEALSKKDFLMRMRIARKEAKESILWLDLIDVVSDTFLTNERVSLMQEAKEFLLIFSSIISKSA